MQHRQVLPQPLPRCLSDRHAGLVERAAEAAPDRSVDGLETEPPQHRRNRQLGQERRRERTRRCQRDHPQADHRNPAVFGHTGPDQRRQSTGQHRITARRRRIGLGHPRRHVRPCHGPEAARCRQHAVAM